VTFFIAGLGFVAALLMFPPSDALRAILYRVVWVAGSKVRIGTYALGFLLRSELGRRLPAPLSDALGIAESVIGSSRLLRGRGRFFVLDLERR
jgi:hypothetical protein